MNFFFYSYTPTTSRGQRTQKKKENKPKMTTRSLITKSTPVTADEVAEVFVTAVEGAEHGRGHASEGLRFTPATASDIR